jgi:TolB-like protein/Flp pilus assembly protein TadD
VLPFENLSGDAGNEYFADGMTEEILNALAQVPDLRVAARTSSFAYKGREVDVRKVARDLGVANVLEGSVRREGDNLRITAQLIDARNGFHLWSETYDRKLESVFAIQEEIAEAIAAELKGSLGLTDGEPLVRNRTANMEAYELYLEARSHVRRRGPGVDRAIGLYERAVERDPAFAPAWAGLAEAWSLAPFYHAGVDSTYWAESLNRAEDAAEKALELDPSMVSAHVALANAHRDRWEWTEAERAYRRALELAPDDPEANQQYGEMLAGMGRTEEALPYVRRAVELDPLAAIRLNALGYILRNAGEPEAALATLRRAFAIDSTLSFVNRSIVDVYLRSGRYAEAERFMERIGVPADRGIRRVTRAIAVGDTATAIRILRSDSLLRNAYVLHALAGDREGVLAALDEGLFGGPFGAPEILWDPFVAEYRDDPRFRELVRSRNLEPR